MTGPTLRHARLCLLLGGSALALAACDSQAPRTSRPADAPVARPAPAPAPAPVTDSINPQPDSRGIVTYPDYQVVLARSGDTVASLGARVGLSAAELASYNGLPADWIPREGDTLVLPPRPGGYGPVATPSRPVRETVPVAPVNDGTWSPELAEAAIDRAPSEEPRVAPLSTPATEPAPVREPISTATATPAPAPSTPAPRSVPGTEPLRHTVSPGETIYSISDLYGAPVSAIAAWNGLGRDLTLRPGQVVLVPLPGSSTPPTAPSVTPPTPATVATVTQPGSTEVLPSPPSATDPLPPNPPRAEIPPSPNLEQYRTDTQSPTKLLQPVRGTVLRPYSRQSATRNDGIDFRADSGEPVLAADDGEVALVSNSLGGLGKILLIRHAGGITTVYGRVDGVTVSKGDIVARGQVIGSVAASRNPSLHFEVRKGAQSVDPAPYL